VRPWTVRLFRRRARRSIPVSSVRSGPLVSLVTTASSAADIAERVRTLEATTYRPVELVVAAENVPADIPGASSSIPVRCVERPPDSDRRTALDAAIADAEGELACLLEPGVEPVFPDWLGHLVETVAAGFVGAGAVLLRAPGQGSVRAWQRTADLSILSDGIDLERSTGTITPRDLGFGMPYAPDPGGHTREAPALSLACVLLRRTDVLSAGGLATPHATDGGPASIPYADAELACRLREAGGSLAIDRRALAWCPFEEPPADPPAPRQRREVRDAWVTSGEPSLFLDRLGPRLFRRVIRDVVAGEHRWSVAPLRVALIGGLRLASARTAGMDWHLVHPPATGGGTGLRSVQADVVVVDDPEADIRESPTGLIRVAWVTTTSPQHLDEFDIVVAASDADRARVADGTSKPIVVADLEGPDGTDLLSDLLIAWADARRVGVRIGPSSWRTAHVWGDYHFARALQRYLERAGYPTRVRFIGDWASVAGSHDDATIHVFGNQVAHNRPSQVNVLWQISHPDLASAELYDTYDHVFVASDRFAARMAACSRVPVEPLHQATDPERFHPDPTGPRHELLFVANYRPQRPVVDWLLPSEHDLAIYGNRWDEHGLDAQHHRGSHIPNAELRRFYSSAAIVLNDTWEDMREAGFISNRIYDALASGAFVLSDDVQGLAEEFDDGVAIYHDADGLRAAVERYLEAPELRREIADRGRAAVLERHTFERRVADILTAMRPLLNARTAGVTATPTERSDPSPPRA
jgi:spore maturation protein CgeB